MLQARSHFGRNEVKSIGGEFYIYIGGFMAWRALLISLSRGISHNATSTIGEEEIPPDLEDIILFYWHVLGNYSTLVPT